MILNEDDIMIVMPIETGSRISKLLPIGHFLNEETNEVIKINVITFSNN